MSINLNKLLSFEKNHLNKILESRDKYKIKKYLDEWGLCIKDSKILPKEEFKDVWKTLHGYYDKKQTVKKIGLNSAYGALLNCSSRFFDQRLGQSTTLTGRTITKHMCAKTNEMMTGEYDHYGKSIVGGDTDSCYFSAYPILKDEIDREEIIWTKESVVELYNDMAKTVSATFPEFLSTTLNVPIKRSTGVIASSRETVSETGIWIVKKRYACLMYDKDGIRLDTDGKVGKVKAMGLDLKRADTPKFVQSFLSDILMDTLTDKGENAVLEKVRVFKAQFEDMKPWQQGTPRAVNKLTHYKNKLLDAGVMKLNGKEVGNLHVPGHVTASLAWNRLKEANQDRHTMSIVDGQKIVVCKLRETADNRLSSIAYPADESRLPDWFLNLPFDSEDMMAGIVDKKVENLLGVLKWQLDRTSPQHKHLETLFDFSGL